MTKLATLFLPWLLVFLSSTAAWTQDLTITGTIVNVIKRNFSSNIVTKNSAGEIRDQRKIGYVAQLALVEIEGQGFKSSPTENQVQIDRQIIPVLLVTSTKLICPVPFDISPGKHSFSVTVGDQTVNSTLEISDRTNGLSWNLKPSSELNENSLTASHPSLKVMMHGDNETQIVSMRPEGVFNRIHPARLQTLKSLSPRLGSLMDIQQTDLHLDPNFLTALPMEERVYRGEKMLVGIALKGNRLDGRDLTLEIGFRSKSGIRIPLSKPIVGNVPLEEMNFDSLGNFQLVAYLMTSTPPELPPGTVTMDMVLRQKGGEIPLLEGDLPILVAVRNKLELISQSVFVRSPPDFFFLRQEKPNFFDPPGEGTFLTGQLVEFIHHFSVKGLTDQKQKVFCNFDIRQENRTVEKYSIESQSIKNSQDFICSVQTLLPKSLRDKEYQVYASLKVGSRTVTSAKPFHLKVESNRPTVHMVTWPVPTYDIPTDQYSLEERELFLMANAATVVHRDQPISFATELTTQGFPDLEEARMQMKVSIAMRDKQGTVVTITPKTPFSLKEINGIFFLYNSGVVPREFTPGLVEYYVEILIGDFVYRAYNGFQIEH